MGVKFRFMEYIRLYRFYSKIGMKMDGRNSHNANNEDISTIQCLSNLVLRNEL